ncbi:MAG: mechanosensitive ion channel domain-containing protein [bacterium]
MNTDQRLSRGRISSLLTAVFMLLMISANGLPLKAEAVVLQDTVYTAQDSGFVADAAGVVLSGAPVVFRKDTLLFIQAPLGPFSPMQRASAISKRLKEIAASDKDPDSIRTVESAGLTNIVLEFQTLMSVTDLDTAFTGETRTALGEKYAAQFREVLRAYHEHYSTQAVLTSVALALLVVAIAFLLFWVLGFLFPRIYTKLQSWEGTVLRTLKFRSRELINAATVTALHVTFLKAVRLILSLVIIYFAAKNILAFLPWTRALDINAILKGVLFSIFATAAAYVLFRASRSLLRTLTSKLESWRGTRIKPLKIKTVEVLSEERILDLSKFALKITDVALLIVLAYTYITFLFSFFSFTRTWASTLFGYIITPLGKVLLSFVNYLPNLFFILVIVFVARFIVKFTRLFFIELEKGTITLPGFYREWATPTYKIVRFVIVVFAVIVIFPYLPGSSSPAFQGVSIFLGVLFSLGSTSAIANMVAGLVLTYMRPFKIGDRVRIADAMGDVVEKTLLVTRVRTIKNVDITIPNAMVLSSHIINFSSSAAEKGLILHTGVTIGYDAPWRQVHELLISAAQATEHILKDPAPFILQTSLDDFYVSYELNAYTDQPNIMAKIYSELHQNIQDKFNEAGVEIMSPHYAAARDGNQIAIPTDYLPKGYTAPPFRIFPIGNRKKGESTSE